MVGKKKTKEELIKLFKYIMPYLKDIDVILFYGSLLGYVRDNEFIDQDDDIDVLVNYDDRDKIIKIAEKEKLKIGINNNVIIQIYMNNIGPFDIYFYHFHEQDILIESDGPLLFSKNDIFPLKKIVFHDIPINIPCFEKKIVEQIYGKKWMTSISKNKYVWAKITLVRRLKI